MMEVSKYFLAENSLVIRFGNTFFVLYFYALSGKMREVLDESPDKNRSNIQQEGFSFRVNRGGGAAGTMIQCTFGRLFVTRGSSGFGDDDLDFRLATTP